MPLLGGVRDVFHPLVRAFLHGGPLDDTWWQVPEGDDPPKLLSPQEGLGAAGPVLLSDFPVPVGMHRYELEACDDGRVVYVWAQDERPQFEFIAVVLDGPAKGYRMDVLGLTEPWPYLRLAPRPQLGDLDGGHMEWIHVPWPDTPPWPEEATYTLIGTLIPPGGIAEAQYVQTTGPPWAEALTQVTP